jgi:hypothetical protein
MSELEADCVERIRLHDVGALNQIVKVVAAWMSKAVSATASCTVHAELAAVLFSLGVTSSRHDNRYPGAVELRRFRLGSSITVLAATRPA